uniref:Uncharacterized protein n=1 Tax=Rhizophora mucronata TaxID=61149 RepID=A0A2P2K616_RHIMU
MKTNLRQPREGELRGNTKLMEGRRDHNHQKYIKHKLKPNII